MINIEVQIIYFELSQNTSSSGFHSQKSCFKINTKKNFKHYVSCFEKNKYFHLIHQNNKFSNSIV